MTTTMFKILGAATTLTGIILTAASANAASLSQTASTEFAFTDIVNQSISIQKFDSSLGTLQKLTIDFTGDIKGNAGFENRSASPALITVTLGGELNLALGNQSLLTLKPQNVSSYQAATFDGINDDGGTSGQTIAGLTASESGDLIFTDSQFLQSFNGTGNVNFLFSASSESVVKGSGNTSSFVDTLARASVRVTYEYEAPQPVSEASAVLGIGLIAGFGLLSQRKKSWLTTSNS